MTRLRQGVGGQALAWRDIDILARTLWGEARGEPELGRVAVAHVVRQYKTPLACNGDDGTTSIRRIPGAGD